jgi:putative ABC transport system ATP-binding protein
MSKKHLQVKNNLLETITSIRDDSNLSKNSLGDSDCIVELSNLTKTHMRGDIEVKAISGISLKLRRQRVSCIVGPSGCGKTTLLNMIGCIDVPSSGSINIMQQKVGVMSDNQLSDFRNENLGYVFQNFNLIAVLSAYENIEYPLLLQNIPKGKRKEIVNEMLNSVGLSKRGTHRPSQLSGGEQQRVAIARALAKQPHIIIADEPTANLDSRTSAEILELMQEVQSRYRSSIIISTHDNNTIAYADDIYQLVDGKRIIHGNKE